MSNGNKVPIKIRETDLVDDCIRLNRRFDLVEDRVSAVEASSKTSANASYGTHSGRLATAPDSVNGSIYVETDRDNLVYQAQSGSWEYVAGVYHRTQAQLSPLIASLVTEDIGMRIYVTDFVHTLWCTGPGETSWAPEDDGRAGEGPILREVDPSPGTGWHLYDGTDVAYLKSDGTIGNILLPNLLGANASFVVAGDANTSVVPATAPTYTQPTVGNAVGGVNAGAGAIGVATILHTHGLLGGGVGADGKPQRIERRAFFRQ